MVENLQVLYVPRRLTNVHWNTRQGLAINFTVLDKLLEMDREIGVCIWSGIVETFSKMEIS